MGVTVIDAARGGGRGKAAEKWEEVHKGVEHSSTTKGHEKDRGTRQRKGPETACRSFKLQGWTGAIQCQRLRGALSWTVLWKRCFVSRKWGGGAGERKGGGEEGALTLHTTTLQSDSTAPSVRLVLPAGRQLPLAAFSHLAAAQELEEPHWVLHNPERQLPSTLWPVDVSKKHRCFYFKNAFFMRFKHVIFLYSAIILIWQ